MSLTDSSSHCLLVTWISFHYLPHPSKSVLQLLVFSKKALEAISLFRQVICLCGGKVWTFFLEYHHHVQNQEVCQNHS